MFMWIILFSDYGNFSAPFADSIKYTTLQFVSISWNIEKSTNNEFAASSVSDGSRGMF